MAAKTPAELDFSDKKFTAIINGRPWFCKTAMADCLWMRFEGGEIG